MIRYLSPVMVKMFRMCVPLHRFLFENNHVAQTHSPNLRPVFGSHDSSNIARKQHVMKADDGDVGLEDPCRSCDIVAALGGKLFSGPIEDRDFGRH